MLHKCIKLNILRGPVEPNRETKTMSVASLTKDAGRTVTFGSCHLNGVNKQTENEFKTLANY